MYLSLFCFSCELSYNKDMEHTPSEIGYDETVVYEKETLLHIEVGTRFRGTLLVMLRHSGCPTTRFSVHGMNLCIPFEHDARRGT